jgi:hypothetical protein
MFYLGESTSGLTGDSGLTGGQTRTTSITPLFQSFLQSLPADQNLLREQLLQHPLSPLTHSPMILSTLTHHYHHHHRHVLSSGLRVSISEREQMRWEIYRQSSHSHGHQLS